jgi:hypothetical protein
MKRIPRDPVRFDVFRAYAGRVVNLHDPEATEAFRGSVAASIQQALGNPKFLYGQHVQAMFQGVVIALGQAQMIKEEDAGGGWYDGEELRIPDYRIVLRDSAQLLVEVKNHNANHLEVSFTKTYVNGLRRYGELTNSDVKLAVYWVGWRTWTLVPLSILDERGAHLVLPFVKAIPANEMAVLGDASIATRFPLTLKLVADPSKPRSLSTDGKGQLTIGDTRLFCAGKELTEEQEKQIALMLMQFGSWEEAEPWAELHDDGTPSALVFEWRPRADHHQGFEIVGSLSEIFSSFFIWRTFKEHEVSRLEIDVAPGQMADLIPRDYKGEALPIWRFILHPDVDILKDKAEP